MPTAKQYNDFQAVITAEVIELVEIARSLITEELKDIWISIACDTDLSHFRYDIDAQWFYENTPDTMHCQSYCVNKDTPIEHAIDCLIGGMLEDVDLYCEANGLTDSDTLD